MHDPLISKKSEGNYELSEAGLSRAYMMTMQRLLVHYAQQALKTPPADAQAMGLKLPAFIAQVIKKLDDYFDQLPQFAAFIKEPNAARLGAYIGQNFMPQLEKVKEKLLETEIPKFKSEYENPYRVPSNDLIMRFASDFAKAPPLTYKPFDPEAEAEEKLKSAELVLPGEEAVAAGGVKPQPGEVLLNRYASFFITARPLSYTPDTGSDDPDENGADAAGPSVPQQIPFRAFVQVVNTVARFIKAADQAGYAKYYQSLPAVQQAAYTYYTLFQKAAQQQDVADDLEVSILRGGRQPQQAHALAQMPQDLGKGLDHPGPILTVRLGTRRPQQIRGRAFERQRVGMLGAMAQGGNGQRLGPDLEQEFADFIANLDLVEHVAQLDRVLDRQGFLLFDLLRNAHQALGGALFGEEARQELLEFLQNPLRDNLRCITDMNEGAMQTTEITLEGCSCFWLFRHFIPHSIHRFRLPMNRYL